VPIYTHREQRRWHLVRHGPLHLVRHLRDTEHGHHRTVRGATDKEVVRHNRLMRVVVLLGFFVVVLIVLTLLSYSPVNTARNDLNAARTIITADLGNKSLLESASGRAQLSIDIAEVSRDAALANASLTGSVPLKLLGYVPFFSTQRDGIIQLSTDVEQATAVADSMLNSLNHLVSNSHGTTVALDKLAGLEFFVVGGEHRMAALDRSSGGLIGPLASARDAFNREDAKLVRLLNLSAKTIAFARPFLGSDGPQTYLIGGMNNAEMRDSGAVLSLDLLTAVSGTFSVHDDSSYGNFLLSAPAPVTLPAGTQKVFGAYLPTQQWPDTDATADFALTGRSMQAMWAQATGQHVDGVLGIDVVAVESILKLTGPVLVPGMSEPVSASNAAYLLLDQAYQGEKLNDISASRRDKIAATVKAAVNEMKQEHVDLDAFASALSKDVQGRHLMVWSDVPTDEKGLLTLDAAGTLDAAAPDRSFHIAVENSTANKLDYFLGVGVRMNVTVDSAGNALVNTTIAVANHALPGQQPSYQYGPDGVNAFVPGQYVARIFFWAPRGAVAPSSVAESGLQLTQSHFSLLPGQSNLVSFATVINHAVVNGRLSLHLIPQARLAPDHLTITLSAPGWNVSGRTHIATEWDGSVNPSWGLTH